MGTVTHQNGDGFQVTQRGIGIFTFVTRVQSGGEVMISLAYGRLVRANNYNFNGCVRGTICWM